MKHPYEFDARLRSVSRRRFLRNAVGLLVPAAGLLLPIPMALGQMWPNPGPGRAPVAGGAPGAVTFVGVGTEASAANGNITLNAPSGTPANNDIWIAVIHSSSAGDTHALSDWTELVQGDGGGGLSHISVWYFRYAGSTPNLTTTSIIGESPIGGIISYRGCKTSGSPANTVGTIGTGTDTTIECPGISPSVANCALLACFGAGDNNTITALGGDYVVAFEDVTAGVQNCFNTNAGADDGLMGLFYDLSVPASATGDVTVTQSGADGWAGVLIALEPA